MRDPRTAWGLAAPSMALVFALTLGGTLDAAEAVADRDLIPTRRVEPQWPRSALLSGTGGYVVIEGVVGKDGSVLSAEVVESKPKLVFDSAALRAVKQWRFKPRIVDGVAVDRPFRQRLDFNFGYGAGPANSPQLNEHALDNRPALDEFYLRLRALCPDRYARADDAPNGALAMAAREALSAPAALPEDNVFARDAVLKADGCLFSSWEQLRDQQAFEVAAGYVQYEPRPERRSDRIVASLRAYASRLGGTTVEPDDMLPARAWLFARLTPGYFELIHAHARSLPASPEAGAATREAVAEANRALQERGPAAARKLLRDALRVAPTPVDRGQLLLALARAHAAAKDYDDALEALAEVEAMPESPWNVRAAALVGSASLCGREGERECFDAALAKLNRELALDERLAF